MRLGRKKKSLSCVYGVAKFFGSLSPIISSVVWANQGATLMTLPSDFPTSSFNLPESCGEQLTPTVIFARSRSP